MTILYNASLYQRCRGFCNLLHPYVILHLIIYITFRLISAKLLIIKRKMLHIFICIFVMKTLCIFCSNQNKEFVSPSTIRKGDDLVFDSHAQAMWVYGMAGRPAMYQTFSTNHLSYTKTLVPIYIFRTITFFVWCCHFLRKNGLLAPK